MAILIFLSSTITPQIKTTNLKTGDKAPSFSALDQYNKSIVSDSLLKKGPVVLIFYRGSWCPVCKKHLSKLQDSLQIIMDKGANVVVVTPEQPEYIEKMISKTGATYSILYDSNYSIMNEFGVSFKLSKKTVPKYYGFTKKYTQKSNGNKDDVLPVPATFVINKQGIIDFIHFNPDYKKRATIEEILQYL